MVCQAQPTDELVARVMMEYGLRPAHWETVDAGIRHMVVRAVDDAGQAYFVKFHNTKQPQETVELEENFVGQLAEKGLPVPRFVERVDGGFVTAVPHPLGTNATTISRGIPGRRPDRYTPALLEQTAQLHARVHLEGLRHQQGQRFNPLRDYHYYQPAAHEVELAMIDAAMAPVADRVGAAWDELPQGLAHLDVRRTNLLAERDQLTGIIDFADISLAPLAFCLAAALWDIVESGGSQADVAAYVSHYQTVRRLTDAEQAALPDLAAVRGWSVLHGLLLTQGPDAPASRELTELMAVALQIQPVETR